MTMNMNVFPGARKNESGAELLARLNTRPNLHSVDPFIFGSSSPTTSATIPSSSSNPGQLIEISGPEGVGKTELALLCAAKACLPIQSNGLASKVVYIDTTYKFSILRFAVILEKLIQQACGQRNSLSSHEISDEVKMCENENDADVESIITESLGRIFVLRTSSSLQLIASLMSLENSVSEDHLYSLLILDTVSAFYWIDKAADADNPSSFKESKMEFISATLSRLVNHYGLTCLALSSALFNVDNKRRGREEEGSHKKTWGMRSDYLGKSWMTLRTKRIFVSRHDSNVELSVNVNYSNSNSGGGEDKALQAIHSLPKEKKRYVFEDDFMKAL